MRQFFVAPLPLRSGLYPLIQRLQHPGVHRSNDVYGGVQLLLGHPCLPCVRKAALDSGVAKSHHRDRQTDEHLLPLGEALNGMGISIERSEISLFHAAVLLSKAWGYAVLQTIHKHRPTLRA